MGEEPCLVRLPQERDDGGLGGDQSGQRRSSAACVLAGEVVVVDVFMNESEQLLSRYLMSEMISLGERRG